MFIPLGALASGLAQGVLRIANSDVEAAGELLARAVEPWVFFAISVWIIPRFHRTFVALFWLGYVLLYVTSIYFAIYLEGYTSNIGYEVAISLVAIISCSASALYYQKQLKTNWGKYKLGIS